MSRRRWHRGSVALTALVLVASSVTSVSRAQTAAARQDKNCHCFDVTGTGPMLPGGLRYGALVRDRHGGEHVIAAERRDPSSSVGALTYLTHRPGERRWVQKRVLHVPLLTGLVLMIAQVAPSGKQILVVADACDEGNQSAEYVGEARLDARSVRMSPTTASPSSTDGWCNDDSNGAAALSAHRAALFASDDLGGPTVTVGKVGSVFPAPTALPDPHGLTISGVAVTRDPSTGELVVIGQTVGWTEYAWARRSKGNWAGPVRIGPRGYRLDSVTAARGRIDVGVDGEPTGAGGLDIIQRGRQGRWSRLTSLSHGAGINDNYLVLDLNPVTGHLHAAFDRTRSKGGGIFAEARIGGTWRKPSHLTTNWRDQPQQITVTSAGHPVIGYER